MYRLMRALKDKIDATKEEREARRNFTIEHAGSVPSMRTEPAAGPGEGEAGASPAA
jgi:hypothetical protein